MVQHGLLSENDAEALQSQAQSANIGFVEQTVSQFVPNATRAVANAVTRWSDNRG